MIKNQLWPKFKMLDITMTDLSVDPADCEIFFFFPFFLDYHFPFLYSSQVFLYLPSPPNLLPFYLPLIKK